MSERGSEHIASQQERFNALWGMLCSGDKLFSDIIEVSNGDGTYDAAIVTTKLEDINPPITDERISQVNQPPDVRVIECVTSDRFVRVPEVWIRLNGNDPFFAQNLDLLEGIVFSEGRLGLDDIPGTNP